MTETELLRRCHTVFPGHRVPDTSVIELYVGDNLLALPDQQVRTALAHFASAMR